MIGEWIDPVTGRHPVLQEMKSGRTRWVKNVARVWAMRNLYMILITKLLSEETVCRWEDN
jgi:hypothetical protein